MDEILPCPFCGGEAEPVNYSPFDGWHCRCKRCDLEGNEWLDEATAVRAWNRRVPPVAVQEERTALDHFVDDVEAADIRDAARYRWLRDQTMPGLFHPQFAMHSATAWKNSTDIDAAIDSAMKGDQP